MLPAAEFNYILVYHHYSGIEADTCASTWSSVVLSSRLLGCYVASLGMVCIRVSYWSRHNAAAIVCALVCHLPRYNAAVLFAPAALVPSTDVHSQAAVYMDVGLLPDATKYQPADEYMPGDFSRDHGCNASSACCICWFSWWTGMSVRPSMSMHRLYLCTRPWTQRCHNVLNFIFDAASPFPVEIELKHEPVHPTTRVAGRCCGVGDMKDGEKQKLFGPEIMFESPVSPRSMMVPPTPASSPPTAQSTTEGAARVSPKEE